MFRLKSVAVYSGIMLHANIGVHYFHRKAHFCNPIFAANIQMELHFGSR